MRTFGLALFAGLAAFGLIAAYSQLVANSRYLARSAEVLQDWARLQPDLTPEATAALLAKVEERVALYEDELARRHLVEGMVVNRTTSGRVLDMCDSLLFSSLRYVALRKLGRDDAASEAWNAIEGSHGENGWQRHPRCQKHTSRDMIVGLLAALTQKPANHREHLVGLMSRIEANGGYFSHGPRYVSYMTPGVARLIGLVADEAGIMRRDRPDQVREGYSTSELTLVATNPGYQAHLVALSVWMDLELATLKDPSERLRRKTPWLARIVEPFSGATLDDQRLEWSTDRLVRLDKSNLFFRYLRLRAIHAMTQPVALGMLQELLASPKFPAHRLPLNCDRRADYVWQRASREYRPGFNCSREYSGVDFLWMAGLLVEAATRHEPVYAMPREILQFPQVERTP